MIKTFMFNANTFNPSNLDRQVNELLSEGEKMINNIFSYIVSNHNSQSLFFTIDYEDNNNE